MMQRRVPHVASVAVAGGLGDRPLLRGLGLYRLLAGYPGGLGPEDLKR